MAFTKITNAELNSRGATTLPNQPAIPPAQLKQEFDAPAKEVVAPKFNNLIDELEAETGAESIGIAPPAGRTGANIQALVDNISSDLAAVEGTVGDATSFSKIKVDADTVEADILDDTVEIEAGAGMVIDVDTANKKITLKAPGGSGGGDMSQDVYDTDHNGIVDRAEAVSDGVISVSAADIKATVDTSIKNRMYFSSWSTFISDLSTICVEANLGKVIYVDEGGCVPNTNLFLDNIEGYFIPNHSFLVVDRSGSTYGVRVLGDGAYLNTPEYYETWPDGQNCLFITRIPLNSTNTPWAKYNITGVWADILNDGDSPPHYSVDNSWVNLAWIAYEVYDFWIVSVKLSHGLPNRNSRVRIGIARNIDTSA